MAWKIIQTPTNAMNATFLASCRVNDRNKWINK